jgi:hypothetical protein
VKSVKVLCREVMETKMKDFDPKNFLIINFFYLYPHDLGLDPDQICIQQQAGSGYEFSKNLDPDPDSVNTNPKQLVDNSGVDVVLFATLVFRKFSLPLVFH